MGEILFRDHTELSTWRKIALGSWRDCGDPSVYAVLKLDVTKILERRNKLKASGSEKRPPTLTAIIGRSLAITMARYPQLNGMLRFGNLYFREHVDLFFQAAADNDGKELSGIRIDKAETKDIYAIMDEINEKGNRIRKNEDPEFKRVKNQFSIVPPWLMSRVLNFTSFLIYTLNLDLSIFGIPKDPFGSAMITNVGMFNVDTVFAPLIPYTRVPLLIAVGAIKDEAVVRDGKVEVRPIVNLCATMDHRFIDGLYGSKMMKHIMHLLETDEGLEEIGL